MRGEKRSSGGSGAALGGRRLREGRGGVPSGGRSKDENDRMWSTASLGLSQRDLVSNVVGCAGHSNRCETVCENKPQSGQTSSIACPNLICKSLSLEQWPDRS